MGGESFTGSAVRLDLVRDAAAAARLPEVLAERCVHSLAERASCRRCVDACPTQAWVIDDERLGIDPARCDGCGLCAPACPQAAIVAPSVEPLRVGSSGRGGLQVATDGAAMLACDRAWPGRSAIPGAMQHRGLEAAPPGAHGDGIVPCIHALGLRDLARLAVDGCRRLVVATGDCNVCPRGGAVRLETRLADLARLLDSRRLPLLRLERLPADRWREAREGAAPDGGPQLRRRAFLSRGLGLAITKARVGFGLASAERERVGTVGNLLPHTARPGALVPVAPAIDRAACTGCDACVRLCPERAIRLEAEAGALAYRIAPQDCTGCGLCVDVCADRAVRLNHWVVATPVSLPLDQASCARCGVRFHRPVIDRAGGSPRCPVCERKGEAGRLFRVQE